MEINFSKIFKIIVSRLLIIVLTAVLFGAAGYAITVYTVKPSYSSGMKLMVISPDGVNTYNEISTMRRMVNTYVELLDSRDFYEIIKEKSGLSYAPQTLKSMITYTTKDESEAFNVSVVAPTKEECAKLIETLDKQSQEYIGKKYSQLTITAVESPSEPVEKSNGLVRNVILMFIGGFVVATLLFTAINEFDVRVHSEEELTEHYDLPILGVVPNFEVKKRRVKEHGLPEEPTPEESKDAEEEE